MSLLFSRQVTPVQAMLPAVLGATLLIGGGWSSAVAQASEDPADALPEVKIGVLANRGSKRCLEMWSATADYLTAQVPGHRFRIVPLGYADAEPAIAERQIDFIFANSAQYVALEQPIPDPGHSNFEEQGGMATS